MTTPFVLNTPSKPVDSGVAVGRTQQARRYMDTFWDNHRTGQGGRFPNGRPWCGPREIAANTELMHEDGFVIPDLMRGEYVEDDTGKIDRAATLQATWHAPWTPLSKFFRFNYAKKRITFDYQKMRLEETKSLQQYYAAAAKLGSKLNLRVEYGVIPDFQITSDLGEPTKYLKIAEAALAGDPWLLGFIDEPNPELAAILGINSRGLPLVTSYTPPTVTPAQVLATPDNELLKMIADMQKQMLELRQDMQADKANAQAKKADAAKRMEKVRAARKPTSKPETVSA